MSLGQRCDEIVRIIEEAIGDGPVRIPAGAVTPDRSARHPREVPRGRPR